MEMNYRTIKTYLPCEYCKGTGLEEIEGRTIDCPRCQGYGEVIETERKELIHATMETERGRTEQTRQLY